MRRRPRLGLWLLIFLALGILAALPAIGGRAGENCEPPPLTVVVQYGDSLWTIAEQYRDPARDVRDIVALIVAANNVNPGALRPGMRITIPVDCLPKDTH